MERAVLPRHTLTHSDGRRLLVYGTLHGRLPESEAASQPPALHQRFDALTADWVAVSPARNTRPQTATDLPDQGRPASCPLCPGGPEVPFQYDAAVFENRFPSFMAHPPPPPLAPAGVTRVAPSVGRCEVVMYTSGHVGSLGTLSVAELHRVVAVWRDRTDELYDDPRHAFVLVFENRGEAVGATLSHPHGQIYAFDRLPPMIGRRVPALREHRGRAGECLSCAVVASDEAAVQRHVAGNDSFTVCVPFAARWPFEVHVRARRHGVRRLTDLRPGEQADLAAALQEVVRRYDGLYGTDLPYMMVAQQAPAEGPQDWHLAFEFLPPHRDAGK